ncbi:MAG: HD domain-containing protein [Candidatus Nanohaloarchaea archaeon]
MEISDPVYGKHEIYEEVLIELIESEPVQRLKEVYMSPSVFFIDERPPVSRYEHSIGVMLLLRKFDASLEEQIAGLLHDVPHTAFSHVADFVFEDENHEYHERFLDEKVYDSEISDILERHGYEIDYILDEDNFGLLERDLPKLCADRLDYSIRDLQGYLGYNMEKYIEGLEVENGEFVFDDFENAEEFGMKFIELDSTVYASAMEVAIFELLADIIGKSFDLNELSEEDLFTTDRELMDKLREINCDEIQMKFELLDSGLELDTGADNYDIHRATKARAVDPPFMTDRGDIIQATERSEKLREAIEEHNQEVGDGFKIKILN